MIQKVIEREERWHEDAVLVRLVTETGDKMWKGDSELSRCGKGVYSRFMKYELLEKEPGVFDLFNDLREPVKFGLDLSQAIAEINTLEKRRKLKVA